MCHPLPRLPIDLEVPFPAESQRTEIGGGGSLRRGCFGRAAPDDQHQGRENEDIPYTTHVRASHVGQVVVLAKRRVDNRQRLRARHIRHLSDTEQSPRLSLRDLHRPRRGALPGAGCGNAVDIAVWNDTLPSTFRSTWWMWPFNTVTEPKRRSEASACSASSVVQPHCG